MSIVSLQLHNFRNIETAELAPIPQGINLIVGNNGWGKTSLLEAIHYLCLGRSFRSATGTRLIQNGSEKFLILCQVLSTQGNTYTIGAERDKIGNTRVRIAEQDMKSILELAHLLPLKIINSQSHNLFEAGPLFRRKFLDWGLFYQHENFLPCWRNFERVLKQRNTLLREKRSKAEIDVWSQEFIKYGNELHELRQEYIQEFILQLNSLTASLLNISSCEVEYHSGWNAKLSLADALAKNSNEELRLGYTLSGPHRADLSLKIKNQPVKHFLSRGQQKLLICAMIVAQGNLLNALENKGLIYLVDDLAAELDEKSRSSLLNLLSSLEDQVFITAIEKESISDHLSKSVSQLKVFHVEHGKLKEET